MNIRTLLLQFLCVFVLWSAEGHSQTYTTKFDSSEDLLATGQATLPKRDLHPLKHTRIHGARQTCNTWKSTPYKEVKHESSSSIRNEKQPLNAKGLRK